MSGWTWVGAWVPGIEGQGVYFAAPPDRIPLLQTLEHAGYEVVEMAGADLTDAAAARAAVAKALRLPDSAASNPDAFADGLAELHSTAGRVLLLWSDAQMTLTGDLPGWTEIVSDLKAASAYLWDPENDDSPDNIVFETVLLVDGYGVEQLS